MSVTPLLPFKGIPDDFIRQINERFRQLETGRRSSSAGASGDVEGASGLRTEGAIPMVSGQNGVLEESSILDDGTKISTTEPVDIVGTGASSVVLLVQNTDVAQNSRIRVVAPVATKDAGLELSDGTNKWVIYKPTDDDLHFYDGAVMVAVMEAGGNLDVTGTVNASLGYKAAGTAGITGFYTLAKVTPGGVNGSITITGGIVTAVVAPT